MEKKQKEEKEEKSKREKRKPYQKPALTVEELFEATVLGCLKHPSNPACRQTGSPRVS
jgi:hypothetical protein